MYKVQLLTNEQTENGEHYVGVETLATSNDLEVAKSLADKISNWAESQDVTLCLRIWSKEQTLELKR
jgi:hypothetical protein